MSCREHLQQKLVSSRGWSREDKERNVSIVRSSKELAEGAAMLAKGMPNSG